MPILTPELQKKLDIVNQYMVNGKLRDDTPDYVRKYDEEITEFYRMESEGVM